jgi:hypothetical protein
MGKVSLVLALHAFLISLYMPYFSSAGHNTRADVGKNDGTLILYFLLSVYFFLLVGFSRRLCVLCQSYLCVDQDSHPHNCKTTKHVKVF